MCVNMSVDMWMVLAHWSGYFGDHPLMCQQPRTWPHMTEENMRTAGWAHKHLSSPPCIADRVGSSALAS